MGTMKYHTGYTPDDTSSFDSSMFLRLRKNGDKAAVIPCFDGDALAGLLWPRHFMGEGQKPAYVTCGKLYGPDAPCPLCSKTPPMKQDWRASMTVWDVKAGERRVLDAIPVAVYRLMAAAVDAMVQEGVNPRLMMFLLTRTGDKKEARIGVVPVPASADALKAAAGMVSYAPEEMVPENTPSAPPRDDAPPPDDGDVPF